MTSTPSLSVLVLDDEDGIRYLLQMELEDRGFKVIACGSLTSALAVMQQEECIDIALLDLRLGDGSGMDALKALHERFPQAPAIIMTGHGTKSVILEALKLGVFDYLEKPFSVKDDLVPVLQRAQAVARLAQENSALHLELKHNAKLVALGEISAVVMHDIRGPLSIIQLCCEDLAEEEASGESVATAVLDGHVKQIERSCSRIQTLCDRLRVFSRDDASEQDAYAGLKEMIEAALYLVKRKTRDLGVEVLAEIPGFLENVKILCPQNGFEQALMNLMSNACDAMEKTSSKKLTIDVKANAESLSICVVDTGVGMSAETLLKISQSFFTTKSANGGTGLGVKIARDVSEKMSGSLVITSTEGQGSCFEIRVPIFRVFSSDGHVFKLGGAEDGAA